MIRRAFARVAAANAALTLWEQRRPILSGLVMAPAIAVGIWALAMILHVAFGV